MYQEILCLVKCLKKKNSLWKKKKEEFEGSNKEVACGVGVV